MTRHINLRNVDAFSNLVTLTRVRARTDSWKQIHATTSKRTTYLQSISFYNFQRRRINLRPKSSSAQQISQQSLCRQSHSRRVWKHFGVLGKTWLGTCTTQRTWLDSVDFGTRTLAASEKPVVPLPRRRILLSPQPRLICLYIAFQGQKQHPSSSVGRALDS